jgi:hypothetical protein
MKRVFLLTICTFFAGVLFAQEGLKIGVRFSPLVSFATVIQDDDKSRLDIGQMSRIGYGYGIIGSYGFSENYALNTGIVIVSRGFSTELADFSSDIRYTALQIPIGFKLRSSEIGSGLHMKALFNGELEANLGYRGITQVTGLDEVESRNPNQMNPISAGFVVGAGVEQENDWGILDFGLSLHRGLTNINNKTNGFADTIIRINYLSLDLGYYF